MLEIKHIKGDINYRTISSLMSTNNISTGNILINNDDEFVFIEPLDKTQAFSDWKEKLPKYTIDTNLTVSIPFGAVASNATLINIPNIMNSSLKNRFLDLFGGTYNVVGDTTIESMFQTISMETDIPNFWDEASSLVYTDYFGFSVAVSDTRIVIGIYDYEGAGANTNSGTIAIFDNNGVFIKIIQPENINWLNSQAQCKFGYSVAISDNKIIAGIPFKTISGKLKVGSVIVMDINGNFINEINMPTPIAEYTFGHQIDISNNRILIGAPYNENASTAPAGKVFLYDTNSVLISELTAPTFDQWDYFGWDVSLSSTRVVVGTVRDAAYIYDINGTFIKKLTIPTGQEWSNFGMSISVSENRIVVGAPYAKTSPDEIQTGALFIYDIDGIYIDTVTITDQVDKDMFGASVFASDDLIMSASKKGIYIYDINGVFIEKITRSLDVNYHFKNNAMGISGGMIVLGNGSYGDNKVTIHTANIATTVTYTKD